MVFTVHRPLSISKYLTSLLSEVGTDLVTMCLLEMIFWFLLPWPADNLNSTQPHFPTLFGMMSETPWLSVCPLLEVTLSSAHQFTITSPYAGMLDKEGQSVPMPIESTTATIISTDYNNGQPTLIAHTALETLEDCGGWSSSPSSLFPRGCSSKKKKNAASVKKWSTRILQGKVVSGQ